VRTVLVASLRTHTRRYVAAAVAVVIGVAFVVVTSALSSATRNGLVAGIDVPFRAADVAVSGVSGEDAARLVADAERRGDHAAPLGWTLQPVTEGDRLIGERTDVGAIAPDPTLRWQELRDGRFPSAADEALADVNAAKADRIEIGDRLRVGSGTRAVEVTVVGLGDSPAMFRGTIYLPWSTTERWASSFYVDSVAYAGTGDTAELVDRLGDETGATVQTADAYVDRIQTEITNEVNVIAIVLLVFAAIALFVSVLVIANTFTILFAQRSRDFALLRCVGATRRQVLRSIRLEALCLGLAASALGLLVGTGLGWGLVAVARGLMPPDTMGTPSPSPWWYAAAFGVGLVVTLVAAWLPTRRTVRVSPLAALRPDDGVDVRTTAGRLRTGAGLALVAGGGVLLGLSIAAHSVAVMIAGGAASFTGVLLLGPIIVPALIRLTGRALGRLLGPAGRLAAGNAVRNPRRTAATTASLLVGVTLTTAVLTGLASARSAVADDMDVSHPVDVVLTSTGEPLPSGLLADVREVPGVAHAVALDGVTAHADRGVGDVQLVATQDVAEAVHGDPAVATPAPGEIHVPRELLGDASPRRLAVTVDGYTERLRVVAGDGWGSAAVVAPATLAGLTEVTTPRAVWVRATADADPEDLAGDLNALGVNAGAELSNGLGERAWVELQMDVLTGSVVSLLAIAVVIALVGIGNTLGLSVLERARENALLRAVGLTRRQLRRMLAVEALLLSIVATVLGTLIGTTFAWVSVEALVRAAVDEAPLVLPWGQLALVVLVAGAAGLLSCLLPARRAAEVTPAAGLALE
jgi:putative ABC transport system permease protein